MLIFKKIKKKAFYLQDYIIIKHKKLYLNKNNRKIFSEITRLDARLSTVGKTPD